MDVSRRTLIVGGTSAIVGAGVGAGVAGVLTADRTGPTLWQRGDRSGAPRVGGLHLQYGADAASECILERSRNVYRVHACNGCELAHRRNAGRIFLKIIAHQGQPGSFMAFGTLDAAGGGQELKNEAFGNQGR